MRTASISTVAVWTNSTTVGGASWILQESHILEAAYINDYINPYGLT